MRRAKSSMVARDPSLGRAVVRRHDGDDANVDHLDPPRAQSRSCLVSRERNTSIMSLAVIRPATTASTASARGA